MTTTKKLVVAVVALSLALVTVVGATLAFLIAESKEVVNTFTVGNIEIDLNETDVDGDSDTKKNGYKVVPGVTDTKDPTVTVIAKSEDCYVYVKVINNLVIDGESVATYEAHADWILVGTSNVNGVVTNLYRYKDVVAYSEADQQLTPVFETVTYSADITLEKINALNGKQIVAQAYAHQAANVDVADANGYACTWAGVSANTNP